MKNNEKVLETGDLLNEPRLPLQGSTTDVNRAEFLWKTIGRMDFYINTTNTKAQLLVAYNAIIIGSILFGKIDITNQFPGFTPHAGFLTLLISMLSILSLFLALSTIKPYVESTKSPTKYHSLIFFQHISELASDVDYEIEIKKLDNASIVTDLCKQAYALSTGTNHKFQTLRHILIRNLSMKIQPETSIN